MPRALLLLLAGLVAVQLPWLGRPVHYDEANFLVLARGAAADPWRPHEVRINWQGVEERAFDVLSNPPGIAWWLAPLDGAPVALLRAWMLPWLALALWGAWRLGARFLNDPVRGALLLLTAPIALLATPSLLPDAPLYALALAGVAGFVDATDRGRSGWPSALLTGCAALFRYSGLALAPLLVLYALLRRRSPLPAAAALVPPALLALHDLHAYGAVHLFAMGRFQSVANTPLDVAHKAVAALCMLGGVGVLPLFPWGRAALGGAVLGAVAASPWGWAGGAFGALGGAALGAAVGGEGAARRDRAFLLAWALGGLLFLLTLRFTAARYWLPFLPGVLLAVPTWRWPRALIAAQLGLGVLLAADERNSARAQEELAQQVATIGTGVFTGHWGWQWALEQRGWRPIDEGTRPAAGTLVAVPREAWPQSVEMTCARVVWEGAARPPFPWLPRGYSSRGRANLHASWIVGPPGGAPIRTVAPFTFANDAYERVRVCGE